MRKASSWLTTELSLGSRKVAETLVRARQRARVSPSTIKRVFLVRSRSPSSKSTPKAREARVAKVAKQKAKVSSSGEAFLHSRIGQCSLNLSGAWYRKSCCPPSLNYRLMP